MVTCKDCNKRFSDEMNSSHHCELWGRWVRWYETNLVADVGEGFLRRLPEESLFTRPIEKAYAPPPPPPPKSMTPALDATTPILKGTE